jgi:hypothetical protein
MDTMPNLKLRWKLDYETAKICVEILMTMPLPPTFSVVRLKETGKVQLWLSARTRDYLQMRLNERRKHGELR